MKLSKERKKELRRIYEEKIGKEYVKELEKQPLVSPMEFVDIMRGWLTYQILLEIFGSYRGMNKPPQHLFTECLRVVFL